MKKPKQRGRQPDRQKETRRRRQTKDLYPLTTDISRLTCRVTGVVRFQFLSIACSRDRRLPVQPPSVDGNPHHAPYVLRNLSGRNWIDEDDLAGSLVLETSTKIQLGAVQCEPLSILLDRLDLEELARLQGILRDLDDALVQFR